METVNSPAEKQKYLSAALASLNSAYTLAFTGKTKYASADFIIPAFIMVLLKAKLQNPIATHKFLQHFGNMSDGNDLEE